MTQTTDGSCGPPGGYLTTEYSASSTKRKTKVIENTDLYLVRFVISLFGVSGSAESIVLQHSLARCQILQFL